MEIKSKVYEIISEICGKDEIELKDSLKGDLGFDSLRMVTLLLKIEERFNIELEETDMNPFDLKTVEDVWALAEKYTGENYEKSE